MGIVGGSRRTADRRPAVQPGCTTVQHLRVSGGAVGVLGGEERR